MENAEHNFFSFINRFFASCRIKSSFIARKNCLSLPAVDISLVLKICLKREQSADKIIMMWEETMLSDRALYAAVAKLFPRLKSGLIL